VTFAHGFGMSSYHIISFSLFIPGPVARPVTRLGTRVAPSELSSYRDEHDFRMPCCLCVIGATDENSYMECAIYLATSGPYSGEYVAGCTSGRCAYLSKLTLKGHGPDMTILY
jgi:hypothetical protein